MKLENSPYVIGVDVGGTKIQIGAVLEDGQVAVTERYRMNKNTQETALHSIMSSLVDFVGRYASGNKPAAIGIGLVGHVDYFNGIWKSSMNIPVQVPIPLAEMLEGLYGVPVFLDNDVNAATLAEVKWGIGQDSKDFVFLNVGTGIAAGIVAEGRLVRGAANYAGELGHMVVDPHDEAVCSCGQRGCLEKTSSGSGIVAASIEYLERYPGSVLHKLADENRLVPSTIFEAASKGDELAALLMNRAIRGLRIGLTNIVNLVNPEAIIVGGGVLRDSDIFQKLSSDVLDTVLPVSRKALKNITYSDLTPDYVGMLGAAALGWLTFNGGDSSEHCYSEQK